MTCYIGWLVHFCSMAGRVETEAGKVLPANWERKDRPWFQDKSSVVERPASHLKHSISEKSTFQEAPRVAQPGGVKTLGLDINAFVPVCYQRASTSFQIFVQFLCTCFIFTVVFAVCKNWLGHIDLGKKQKGSNFASEKTVSAQKHDTEIIEELLHQHHTMASIMQSRLTNMQVCTYHNILRRTTFHPLFCTPWSCTNPENWNQAFYANLVSNPAQIRPMPWPPG